MSTHASPTTPTEVDLVTRRRAEILYGATSVIAREGVTSAKLKDIAKTSGVSLGLVQHYFDTKEALVNETFATMMLVIDRVSRSRLGQYDDPVSLIYASNVMQVYGTVEFPARWGFWSELWANAARSAHLGEVAQRVYALWAAPTRQALHTLAATGNLPENRAPDTLATGLLALIDGLSLRTLAEPNVFTPEHTLEVLHAWTTDALGLDPQDAKSIATRIVEKHHAYPSPTLSPTLIAETLLAVELDQSIAASN